MCAKPKCFNKYDEGCVQAGLIVSAEKHFNESNFNKTSPLQYSNATNQLTDKIRSYDRYVTSQGRH